MEVWASAMARAEDWAKLWEDSFRRILAKCGIGGTGDDTPQFDDPINILKRLQRESFYELMKLRDRQEKLERVLALNKALKGSPFGETGGPTHMKGIFSVNGSLPFLNIAGIRTGVDSRFIFQTVTREKDTLIAEFNAGQKTPLTASPLALSKVLYLANISDWLSLVSVPFGAQCHDFGFNSQALKGLMEPSSFDPQFFNQLLGCAAGLRIKSSNIAVTTAQSVSSQFSSFGQVDLQLFYGARVSFMGLRQAQALQMSPLETEQSSSGQGAVNSGALVMESEIDESSRIRGWVEFLSPNSRRLEQRLQWGISLLDTPEEEMGWGLKIGGGRIGERERWVRFESFLNFCIGKRLTLRPGLVYTVDGRTRSPTLVFNSGWTL